MSFGVSIALRVLALAAVLAAPTLMPAAAAPLTHEGQVVRGLVVRLKPGVQQRETPQVARERLAAVAGEAGLSGVEARSIGARVHALRLSRARTVAQFDAELRRLRLHPEVASVEPDVLLRPARVPNDTDYNLQWHLGASSTQAVALNMPAAWDLSTGSNIVVAVVDTGARFSHPDLQGQWLSGHDFASEVDYANDGDGRDADATDPGDWVSTTDRLTRPALYSLCAITDSTWHGTFIAGQIAALSDNSRGVAGLNWSARILPVRVSGKCGAYLSDILDGVRWAAGLSVAGVPTNPTPARVINLSFGGDQPCTDSYQAVIDEATAAGALVVVAAGNDSGTLRRPADCRNVLAVTSVNSNGAKASYANFGSNIALAAPGGVSSGLRLYSTSNDGTQAPGNDSYGYKAGTSFSAPLAAGVAALMLSLNPSLTPAQLIARMRESSRPHLTVSGLLACSGSVAADCNCTSTTCGAGLLDAAGALQRALGPAIAISGSTQGLVGQRLSLDASGSSAAPGAGVASFAWRQLSGATLSLSDTSRPGLQVQLPGAPGEFVLQLTVTDTLGRSASERVTLTATGESVGVVVAGGGSGGGGGGADGAWVAAVLALLVLAARRRG